MRSINTIICVGILIGVFLIWWQGRPEPVNAALQADELMASWAP